MTDSTMDALFGAQMKAGDNQLKNIAALIAEEQAADDELKTGEAIAAQAKERRTQLRNVRIPQAMLDAGVREFTTDDGIKAKIAFSTDGSLGSPKTPEEYEAREKKFDMIEEAGGGEIIKMTVAVDFPKDRFDEAAKFHEWLQKKLEKKKLTVTKMRTVNHQTLGSWIRARMSDDDVTKHFAPDWLEKLGIWYGEIAKITRPKPK